MKGINVIKQGIFKAAALGALMLAGVSGYGPAAQAQSTIFNIPTTDTVSPKKGYLEFDYLVQLPVADGAGRTQIFLPRIVVGVAPNLEVGANFANIRCCGSGAETYSFFQPNAKYKFYSNDDKGWAIAAGGIGYTPINKRDGVDSYGLIYGALSKKVKSSEFGPRITIGPYGIVGAEETYYGTKAGAIVGFEQPVTSKVSFVADWFSGVSGFGYFTPGISIVVPHNGLLNFGYSFGNDSWGDVSNNNRYFFAYYGVTFP